MGITHTKFPTSTEVNHADAFVYRGAVQATGYRLDYGQEGVVGDNADILNNIYDLQRTPSGLGSGVFVNNVGRYLYSNEYGIGGEPIAQFTVLNMEGNTIYAGVNIDSSGWSVSKGVPIESGASYTFGSDGTQAIRNVWAVCLTAQDSLTAGYATNLDSWSV
jgi:hypothetical protein